MGEYKVLITTSGVGSRLGELTTFTNKSLVRVGKKPAISYVIENYPDDIEIVVTLGYWGGQVRDFLTLAYPKRKFTFVVVDKYDGDDSSLGYSLLQAKGELQCPFIFHAADTIVSSKINEPIENWLGVCHKPNHSQYRTVRVEGKLKIYEKGHIGSTYAYIGLAGIRDYKMFWGALESEYAADKFDTTLSDCHAINRMLPNSEWVTHKYDDWLDIGNASELSIAREKIVDKFDILDKIDESIFLFDDFVIKFFHNETVCKNRVDRGNNLGNLTPTILGSTNNFYKYEYSVGELLADCVDVPLFKKFLSWSNTNLWTMIGKQSPRFTDVCKKFYFDKTNNRLDKFFKDHNIEDGETKINGFTQPSVKTLIKSIDEDWLCTNVPSQFHGDFILDNIIRENDGNFKLLDWRQDFGGELENGDIYYDLAKLNHNLLFNHHIVNEGHYTITEVDGDIRCDIYRSDILTECREELHKFIVDQELDLSKVKLLTAIIWLNMAPLHEPKLGRFLFYLGKLNLDKILKTL
jgi:choline kinase